jgi:hypothetical protein
MTKIYTIHLTKQSLAAMPDAERKLLLLLGHATNEIIVFQRLVVASVQGTYAPEFVDNVQAGQTLILIRVLIGKLCEAWELFRVRFLSERQLADRYLPKLNEEASAALERLKKHFGAQSPLTLIRNRFSFHYRDDDDLVEQSFQDTPADDEWRFYLSHAQGNSFYYASELVVQYGTIKLAAQAPNDADSSAASNLAALGRLIVKVSGQIMALFVDCIDQIVAHSLPNAQITDEELPGLRPLSDLRIPFFLDDTVFKPKN